MLPELAQETKEVLPEPGKALTELSQETKNVLPERAQEIKKCYLS